MDLHFEKARANNYKSGTQRARVLTEHWVASQMYCPNCGNIEITCHTNNNQVSDFYCSACKDEYELKSQRAPFGGKAVGGAFQAMIERLGKNSKPNHLLLNYDVVSLCVTDLVIIPKQFFTKDIIEERKPLPPTARRAGWIGCRILLQNIPQSGRIAIIRNGLIVPKSEVLANWQRTLFLRKQDSLEAKSWLLHVMHCIEQIEKPLFSLDEVYRFEAELSGSFPENRHVKAKIRQQLQLLRDNGYLDFEGRGKYRLTSL